ncbi:unnamed protein product, partial [Mesorhabditis spiculigera]
MAADKVSVLLHPVGDAPILKKTRYSLDASHDIAWFTVQVRKMLALPPDQTLFFFIAQSFAPSPDHTFQVLRGMALVSYGSGSGSESDEDDEQQTVFTATKPAKQDSAVPDDFFADVQDEDDEDAEGAGFHIEEGDVLEDVVKPKAWEKELAEKERLRREKKEKKAKKKEKKRAKKEAKEREAKSGDASAPSAATELPKPKKKAQIQLFGGLKSVVAPASDSEDEERPGPSALSQPGAKGLLGMLPAPKVAAAKPLTGKSNLLLPASLRKAPAPKPVAPVVKPLAPPVRAPIRKADSDSEDEDDGADFFGLRSEPAPKVARLEEEFQTIPIMPTDGQQDFLGPARPAEGEVLHPSEMYNMANFASEGRVLGKISDQEAHRMIQMREPQFSGMGIPEIVNNIQEFSVNQALGPDVHSSLMRNLTKATLQSASKINVPKSVGVRDVTAKRKNQITHLAQLAVAREDALQEERSQAKHNKRMAKQKYGF